MLRLVSLCSFCVAAFSFCEPTAAQVATSQDVVLQRLSEIQNQLNEMDKRYEIRFTKIEEGFNLVDERFNRIEDKITAVNQRIDDKFNLIIGLLVLVAAFLSVPAISKLFEKIKPGTESKVIPQQVQELQDQINQLKAQIAHLTSLIGKPI